MSKFIAASRQATDLDKTRILLEKRIKEVKDESKVWAEVAAKAKRQMSYGTLMKNLRQTSSKRILVLTIFRRVTMS